MAFRYSVDEQALLLRLARQTLEAVSCGGAGLCLDLGVVSSQLRRKRGCFVTLYQGEVLRGCTGTLVARYGLAEGIVIVTRQTALADPRFPPVKADELPDLLIEISVLTRPRLLHFDSPDDLLLRLRPGTDGVVLHLGEFCSTFLPQVWQQLPDPAQFLTHLSYKMGLDGNAWRSSALVVETYQAVIIAEPLADRGT